LEARVSEVIAGYAVVARGTIATATALGVLVALGGDALAAPPTADECATASESGQSLRKAGKLRAARQQILFCAAQSCPGVVRDDCAAQLAAVDAAMPSIVFVVTDTNGDDVGGVGVTMDGAPLAPKLNGAAVSVDPGEHVFGFQADGFRGGTRKIVVREAVKERKVAVVLAAADDGASASDRSDGALQSADETQSPSHAPAFVAFGVAGAGAVAGVLFAILAVKEQSKCSELTMVECDHEYNDHGEKLTLDNIAWAAGLSVAAVGAAIGMYLVLSRPAAGTQSSLSSPRPTIEAHVGFGWLGMEGQF
jgi:hypothetical protein